MPYKKMGQGIIGNMRVCTGPSLPEPGAGLKIAVEWDAEWQDLAIKTHTRVWIGGINTGYAGSLEILQGRGYGRFG